MKKVIDQKYNLPTKEDIIRESKELDSENIIDSSYQMGWKEGAYWYLQRIEKAREVALAICPELGEPTIKTDNTKVILHLESELKEAVELIGKIADHEFSYDELVTFLIKHKSKE